MAYLSLYRKYRSQSFDEVSGQDHVTRTLQNAIRGDRVAHAYLFCGPRGTGKTSTARLLAKALNCEHLRDGEPCNACSACEQITAGSFMDMKEIDAASHRGIEEIRALRDSVAYVATQGRYKVYVIDEAHQITGDAFNALLKTLEEPPAHVVFILATTEAHKIPATIVSRCQKFDFRRASLDQLKERVRYVAAEEGAEIQDSAVELIAREANGGWRDALSLLEQVLAFAEGPITARDVYTVLGTVEAETLFDIAHAVFARDGSELFARLDELIRAGKDPRQLLRDVTQHYRNLMLTASGAAPEGEPELQSRLVEQAKLYGSSRLLAALEVLAHTERDAKWSEAPRLLLEVALVRLMHPREEAAVAAAVPAAPPARSAARPEARPQPARRPSSSPFVEEAPPVGFAQADAGAELPPPPVTVGDARAGGSKDDDEDLLSAFPEAVSAAAPSPPAAAGGGSPELNTLRAKWRLIGEELKRDRKVMIAAALTDTVPERFEADTLVIAFPSKTMAEMFTSRGKAFSEPLSQVIERLTGIRTRLLAEHATGKTPAVARGPQRSARAAAEPTRANGGATLARPAATSSGSPDGSELVHNVLDVFDGRIVEDTEL